MTKEAIIVNALRLFLTRGYQAVSLVDVAAAAGITKGGIYHYFSSKDELLQRSLELLGSRLTTRYQELLSDRYSIRQLLHLLLVERTVEQYCSAWLQLETVCRLDYAQFALELVHKCPNIQQQIEYSSSMFCQMLTKRLQQAAASGEIPSELDCTALATTVLALVSGQNAPSNHCHDTAMRKRVFDLLIKLLRIS